jgi:hypothetical protein
VIGSLAPDLEYLFHLSPTGHIGHTIPGLFVFCVPIGLVSLLIVHSIWAPPANVLLNREGSAFTFLPFGQLRLICLAILIGALSHLVWDSFTHSYGWMVQRVPILRMAIMDTPWGTLKLFKILQHASTAIGLVILGVLAFPSAQKFPTQAWKLGAILVGTSIAGGVAVGFAKAGIPRDFDTARGLIGIAVVGSFVVFTAETTIAGIAWRLRKI